MILLSLKPENDNAILDIDRINDSLEININTDDISSDLNRASKFLFTGEMLSALSTLMENIKYVNAINISYIKIDLKIQDHSYSSTDSKFVAKCSEIIDTIHGTGVIFQLYNNGKYVEDLLIEKIELENNTNFNILEYYNNTYYITLKN